MQKSIREHSATMHSEMDETIAIENQDPFVRWRFDSTSMEVNDNENLASKVYCITNLPLLTLLASSRCGSGASNRPECKVCRWSSIANAFDRFAGRLEAGNGGSGYDDDKHKSPGAFGRALHSSGAPA